MHVSKFPSFSFTERESHRKTQSIVSNFMPFLFSSFSSFYFTSVSFSSTFMFRNHKKSSAIKKFPTNLVLYCSFHLLPDHHLQSESIASTEVQKMNEHEISSSTSLLSSRTLALIYSFLYYCLYF